MPTSRAEARFSTYSGAPSLQPSLAPTYESSSARSSTHPSNPRLSQTTTDLHPHPNMSEKHHHDPSTDTPGPYNAADPTAHHSTSTLNSTADPKAADLKSWSGALERMQDKRLEQQRYVMGDHKSEEVSKLALGAKVDRALARRMVGQDAAPPASKKAIDEEKRGWEVEAN